MLKLIYKHCCKLEHMRIKVKVANFTNGRLIIEIPKAVRDNFKPKDLVYVEKVENE